ncbi:GNAT family N-acetyltransferase [Arenibacter sp. M-2]|uniref:GNAT family N-acetyltransferase n=1 Tax=unclassified Arenibacter TaxID=2615047 RepID=UPI000D75D8C3|nr:MULTISPECIES: GNAT family N-acetyltransferase [unclassified Arenibacter]MDL5513130.1 GNAT family N-acetyltransferase [Arenibacter sp. M-2]PXX29010.1 RimJ/RimL family protein N-acetyltransferase [Arenibacter sp. ARW7G5Y1]
MGPYKTFVTERLTLKPTSAEDAAFIYELFNTPKWLKNIGDRNINSPEMAKEYILSKMKPQLERLGYSNYTLIRKTDKVKIGCCGLYDREGLEGIDIGFAFLPQYEGQGFAFEAADKLKNIAFDEFGLHSLSAITSKHNVASQRLLEKLGLALAGTTTLPNGKEELLLYKIEK